MDERRYYSTRTGKNRDGVRLDLPKLRKLFYETYRYFDNKGYFQEAFGYECVDAGYVEGFIGYDIASHILRKVRKENLWPIKESYETYCEHDLFDMIEYLFDSVSEPLNGQFHSYNGCGWHYDQFDKPKGQNEFCQSINELLRDYSSGYRLSEKGEILALADPGLDRLLTAEFPPLDADNVDDRVNAAKEKFLRYASSIDERRDAIRDLADVLEYLKPRLSSVLTHKDESDLFELANRFGIRHHDDKQKTRYERAVWYSWMFYYYLATIHATRRLLEAKQPK